MKKEDLKRHYSFLKALHTEFLEHDSVYNKGAKKAKKTQALYDLEVNLMLFKSYCEEHPELSDYFFLVSGNGNRDYYLNELNSLKYFGKDMSRILKIMESEIKEAEKLKNE